jgi:N-ethylmaleimide reductase
MLQINVSDTEIQRLIYCNTFTADKAEAEMNNGDADLIAFGRTFLANPDLE